jgi:hypothetical protein
MAVAALVADVLVDVEQSGAVAALLVPSWQFLFLASGGLANGLLFGCAHYN